MIMLAIATMEDNDKFFMINLYTDYYGLVRKTVYNITHDANNTEDLIQDTFIKLIGKISLLRTLDSCKTAAYVVYTSRSVAINYIKHKDVQKKHASYGGDADLSEKIFNLDDTIENRIIQREELEEWGNAILRLPDKQKDLLYFKYILEISDAEIAEIFGITPGSVRQYLTRARREAKDLINKEMNKYAE